VDDSIIRGTTTMARIAELKKAGAREVHMRVSCPPTRFPCFYGVDFPSCTQLIAARHSLAEIKAFLKADSLGYLSVKRMVAACGGGSFCRACYDGQYPIPPDDRVDKEMMERAHDGAAVVPAEPSAAPAPKAARRRSPKAAPAAAVSTEVPDTAGTPAPAAARPRNKKPAAPAPNELF
jgi:hypothetical protein